MLALKKAAPFFYGTVFLQAKPYQMVLQVRVRFLLRCVSELESIIVEVAVIAAETELLHVYIVNIQRFPIHLQKLIINQNFVLCI